MMVWKSCRSMAHSLMSVRAGDRQTKKRTKNIYYEKRYYCLSTVVLREFISIIRARFGMFWRSLYEVLSESSSSSVKEDSDATVFFW